MAPQQQPQPSKTIKRDIPFTWEGMDKKGNRVKGKSLAPDEAALRADLRRQGIARQRVRKQSHGLQGRRQGQARRHRGVQPPARHHAGRGHSAGAGVRDRRQRPRQAGDAEADSRHQGRRRGRHLAARGARQASAVFRRSVRQSRRGGRAGRCARDPARQDRHLQGKDRGPEEEGEEGPLLSGRGAGRGHHRHGHPADLRDSAVREPVQGLRRGPAGLHAVRHRHVARSCRTRASSSPIVVGGAGYAFFYFKKRSTQDARVPRPRDRSSCRSSAPS